MHGVGLRRRVGRQCIRHIGNLHRWREVRQRCHGRRHGLSSTAGRCVGAKAAMSPCNSAAAPPAMTAGDATGIACAVPAVPVASLFRNQRSRRRAAASRAREARQQSRRQVRRRVRRTPRHSDGVSGRRRSTGGTIAMESGASPITEGSPASKSSQAEGSPSSTAASIATASISSTSSVSSGTSSPASAAAGGASTGRDCGAKAERASCGRHRVGQDRNIVVCARRGCGASAHRPARGVHAPSARIIPSRKGCAGAVRNRAPCRTSSARGPRPRRRRRCRRFPQAARSG